MCMQEFWPLEFKRESMVVIFEVNNSAIPSHSGTSFALWAISNEWRMHLQVNYVRPAPTVLRLDPMQIAAKTETKISLYMKYLAPVSSVSQVSIKSSRACNTSHCTSIHFTQTSLLLILCVNCILT
jgi:hypothetical protein